MTPSEQRKQEATEFWSKGLTRPGQRNEALLALAIDCARRGVPRENAVQDLRDWLCAKHNGVSKTFNSSPARACGDIPALIARVYDRSTRSAGATWGSPQTVSEYETRRLLADLDAEKARTDPATGELIERFELERFLFELLRRAKEWVAVQATRIAGPRETVIASIWPDHTRPEFLVPIPKKMRRKIRGFGSDRHVDLWRTLVRGETLKREQGSSAKAHRAARYWVRLDFGAFSSNKREFACLASALVDLLCPDALESRYGRETVARIRRDAESAPTPASAAALGTHELFVRERLKNVIQVNEFQVPPGQTAMPAVQSESERPTLIGAG